VLDRLAGLETEYAIRYRPALGATQLTRFRLYQRLTGAIRRRVLTVPAHHSKEGVFTANGGAVWFEAERPASGAGLIEGATPECRGPRQLLVYQRAQDRLLAESARSAEVAGEFQLIKNDRDAEDNVYGGQENYEVNVAEGLTLWAWRAGLVLLLPIVFVAWLGYYLLITLWLIYLFAALGVFLVVRSRVNDRHALVERLFGRDFAEGRETGGPTPAWMEPISLHAIRLFTCPLALALLLHCRCFAFRRQRRGLKGLLVSRAVLCGAGMIDHAGRFQLADKAPAINCLVGYGGYLRDRPLFVIGHFFKLCVECRFSLREYFSLFRQRQRLQIGLGDSNMAEPAEYLRIGTTMMVLDLIEAGALKHAPRIRRPIAALRTLCGDPTLRAEVLLRGGQKMTALELQRFYLEACRRYCEAEGLVRGDVAELLHLWEEALEGLVEFKQIARPPLRLVGMLDWVTKKYLIDELGPDATWEAKKKVDLRYHELSDDGYFERLRRAGLAQKLVDDREIDRAIRLAPPHSPATARGRYIREFSGTDEPFAVNWRCVTLGRGFRARVIWLDRYGRPAARSQLLPAPPVHPKKR